LLSISGDRVNPTPVMAVSIASLRPALAMLEDVTVSQEKVLWVSRGEVHVRQCRLMVKRDAPMLLAAGADEQRTS
jgi:hypothetical protein